MTKPLIQGHYKIQKMQMKGGWSYVMLPPVHTKTGLPFGWFIVRGFIDDYEINQFKLWPTADNQLFLPIKAQIRKKIRKEEGDSVFVVLYEDDTDVKIPDEFLLCLEESPAAFTHFKLMSPTNQKQYIDYIYSTKSIDARVHRMTKAIQKIELGLKYHEQESH